MYTRLYSYTHASWLPVLWSRSFALLLQIQVCLFDCSDRTKVAKEQARIFVHTTQEKCMQSFDQFCVTLTKTIEKNLFACMSASGTCRSKCVQGEKLWSSFHHIRRTTLNNLWHHFLSQPGVPNLSPLVYQYVNQKLYEKQMKSYFARLVQIQYPVIILRSQCMRRT